MHPIVIDLSTVRRVVLRPIQKGDLLPAARTMSEFWLKTPHGNVLVAIGPEQFGALLAMAGAIEGEINFKLKRLLASITSLDLHELEIAIEFADDIDLLSVRGTGLEQMETFKNANAFHDRLAQIRQPKPEY
ncbi:hypothetical protein [Rhizobium gallicum]|uniref:hypothetical protein n=1 Tax=Rhizobium gallicum TaxID=56730 RepID=UPI000360F837